MPDLTQRHDAIQRARALFANDHLPDGSLRKLSDEFTAMADFLIATLPDDAMLREALIKLWESKNYAVYVAARIGLLPPAVPLPPPAFGAAPHVRQN
jgi:hypothetical protein